MPTILSKTEKGGLEFGELADLRDDLVQEKQRLERLLARVDNVLRQTKLVEVITNLFRKVSAVNGFARKYVDEYFRLWKQAVEFAPIWAKNFGFKSSESQVV